MQFVGLSPGPVLTLDQSSGTSAACSSQRMATGCSAAQKAEMSLQSTRKEMQPRCDSLAHFHIRVVDLHVLCKLHKMLRRRTRDLHSYDEHLLPKALN